MGSKQAALLWIQDEYPFDWPGIIENKAQCLNALNSKRTSHLVKRNSSFGVIKSVWSFFSDMGSFFLFFYTSFL